MDSGLTIAFICNGDTHSSFVNYKKFGKKYWNDGKKNSSKAGYYFAYYFRQQYVYIHKIINITIKPPENIEWSSDRKWLWLSERLKKFTWNEWINDIGIGSPYTPTYRMTQTNSWSQYELKKTFKTFNFINFIDKIKEQDIIQNNIQLNIVQQNLIDKNKLEQRELEQQELEQQKLEQQELEQQELEQQELEQQEQKMIIDLHEILYSLRKKQIKELDNNISELKKLVNELETQIIQKEKKRKDIEDGINDNTLLNILIT